jgi:hypothetical protein
MDANKEGKKERRKMNKKGKMKGKRVGTGGCELAVSCELCLVKFASPPSSLLSLLAFISAH